MNTYSWKYNASFICVLLEQAQCYYAMMLRIDISVLPKKERMVMQLMKTVVFYIDCFVWQRGVLQVLPPSNHHS